MNCKKCGYPLVSGQVICSNCDTENEVVTNLNNFNTVNNNTNYKNQASDTYNNYESNFNESKPKKKKNTALIIGIILIVVILVPTIFIVLLGLIMGISTYKVNSTIKDVKYDSFIFEYQMIRKQVELRMFDESVVCDEDCNMIYEYNNKHYELEVEDLGNYYKITLEIDDDYNVNLSASDCASLSNVVCSDDEKIGRVYKN